MIWNKQLLIEEDGIKTQVYWCKKYYKYPEK